MRRHENVDGELWLSVMQGSVNPRRAVLQVVTYVAGAVTELTRVAENREQFYTSGGVQALMRYQLSTDADLIVNVNNALANCALHATSLASVWRRLAPISNQNQFISHMNYSKEFD